MWMEGEGKQTKQSCPSLTGSRLSQGLIRENCVQSLSSSGWCQASASSCSQNEIPEEIPISWGPLFPQQSDSQKEWSSLLLRISSFLPGWLHSCPDRWETLTVLTSSSRAWLLFYLQKVERFHLSPGRCIALQLPWTVLSSNSNDVILERPPESIFKLFY